MSPFDTWSNEVGAIVWKGERKKQHENKFKEKKRKKTWREKRNRLLTRLITIWKPTVAMLLGLNTWESNYRQRKKKKRLCVCKHYIYIYIFTHGCEKNGGHAVFPIIRLAKRKSTLSPTSSFIMRWNDTTNRTSRGRLLFSISFFGREK